MRIGAAAAAAAVLMLGSLAARAETLNFYYVSGPAFISNQEDPADRELVNTGWLKVDRDLLPGGPSLANRSISVDFDNWCCGEPFDPAAFAVSYGFAWGEFPGDLHNFTITFDEGENISNWGFDNYMYPAFEYTFGAFGRHGDTVVEGGAYDVAGSFAHYFLTQKGYVEGTPAYEALRCGAWTGGRAECGELGETSEAWAAHYTADPGIWFKEDPLAFAAQVEAVTRAALASPPRSYHEIAPVPLPAPLALLAAAIAGLAVAGRRRRSGGH